MKGGALAPIGGYKGYGLSVLVEVMSGVLSGAAITKECLTWVANPDKPSENGHWITVWDIEAFMPMEEFKRRLTHLRTEIYSLPTASGYERVLLPGDLEVAHERESQANGLELEDAIWEPLVNVAQELGRTAELERARLGNEGE